MEKRIILGIDPGLQHTGWGIVSMAGNQLAHVANGTIHTNTKAPIGERLAVLHSELASILAQHTIDSAAMEETFVNQNAASSLKLGHARGTLMAAISLAGLNITEYAPTKVKKSVVGVGRADKHQVTTMVKMLLANSNIDSADSADALAVAICHANHMNLWSVCA